MGRAPVDSRQDEPNVEAGAASELKRALLREYLRARLGPAPAGPPRIARCPAGTPLPLSMGQEDIWRHTQTLPVTTIYNEPLTIHRTGPLDVSALERSFTEILRRHEAWRTIFAEADGRLIQGVNPPPTIKFRLVDLRGLPEEQREAEALRVATEQAQQPLDLGRGPLLRTTLVRLHELEHRLYLTLHWGLFECGTMYFVFLRQLSILYEAFSTGRPSPLPELTLQYGDYAYWERQWVEKNLLPDQIAYWKKQLAGAPAVLALPTDRPRPLVRTFHSAQFTFSLPKDLTDSVKALSQRESVTLFMSLLTAFSILLARSSGQEDILVATITSIRPPEVESLLGLFHNTLLLRSDLSGNPTLRELLARERDVVIGALMHGDVPVWRLLKELKVAEDVSVNPLFQVKLVLWPPFPPPPQGWNLTQMDVPFAAGEFDLYLDVDDRPEGMSGRFVYNPDLFGASTIARIFEDWKGLLEQMVDGVERRISDFQVGSTAVRARDGSALRTPCPMSPRGGKFDAGLEAAPRDTAKGAERQASPRPLACFSEPGGDSRPGTHMDPGETLAFGRVELESENRDELPPDSFETTVATIWAQCLGVEDVGSYDNFFDLGGNSLAAAQAIALLEKELGLRIGVRDLVFQTLGQFAAACKERLTLPRPQH